MNIYLREVKFKLLNINKSCEIEKEIQRYIEKFYNKWHNKPKIKYYFELVKKNNSFYNIKISLYYSSILNVPQGIAILAEGNPKYDKLFELTALYMENFLRAESLEYIIIAPAERFMAGFEDLNYLLDEIYNELVDNNDNENKEKANIELNKILSKIDFVIQGIKLFDDKVMEIMKKHKLKLKSEHKKIKTENKEHPIKEDFKLKFFEQGSGYYNLGMYDESIAEFEKILEVENNNIKALLNIGWLYLLKNNNEKAAEYFEKVLKLNESNASALNGRGIIYFKNQEIKKAKKYFLKSVKLDANSENAYFAFNSLGEIYFKEKLLKNAINNFTKAISIDNTKIEAHINLAHLYHFLGIYESSEKEYKYCLKIRPNDKKIKIYQLLNTAQSEIAKQNFVQAEKIYKNILRFRPSDPTVYNNFGNLLFKLNKFKRAILMYKKALRIKYDYNKALYNLGLTYEKLNELKKSQNCYLKILETNPEEKYSLNQLGWLEYLKKNFDNAIDYFLRATKKDPNFILPLINLGWIYIQEGELTKALHIYQNLIVKCPDNPIIRNDLGIVYFKLKIFEKANYEFLSAINLSNNPELIAVSNYYLGLIQLEKGDENKAITFFNNVLEYEKEHIGSIEELMKIYKKEGDVEKYNRYKQIYIELVDKKRDENKLFFQNQLLV